MSRHITRKPNNIVSSLLDKIPEAPSHYHEKKTDNDILKHIYCRYIRYRYVYINLPRGVLYDYPRVIKRSEAEQYLDIKTFIRDNCPEYDLSLLQYGYDVSFLGRADIQRADVQPIVDKNDSH